MNDSSLDDELVETARQFASATPNQDLFESQMSYWLAIQGLWRTSGYEAVKKRCTAISPKVAQLIGEATVPDIMRLCTGSISTIKPAVPEETIIEMIESPDKGNTKGKMVLQVLAQDIKVERSPQNV